MAKDKRRAIRRPMRYTAWIALGADRLQGCVLADVSDTGCRIDVENVDTVPENFTLWLARNGSARRKCKVVWRKERQIGVAFDRPVFNPEQIPLVPDVPVAIVSIEPGDSAPLEEIEKSE
jgi:hypothetical protein